MKPLNKIFTGIMCGVLMTNGALAVGDCTNYAYKQSHPEQCEHVDTATNSDHSLLWLGGGVAIAGGVAALVGLAGGGSSSSGGSSYSAGAVASGRTIAPTMIVRNGVAPDLAGTDLTTITSTKNYKLNAHAYDDIQLAYSIARELTGDGTKIAIFDTDLTTPHSHGAAVTEIAGGPIAPNATIEHKMIAFDTNNFMSYNQIGNIIHNTADAHVYNNSWNVSAISADTITSRTQLVARTSQTFVNAISDAATQKDAIFVWAAGNDGNAQSGMLSAMPQVMPELNGHFVNVVAWDSNTRTLADYSNACGATMNYCLTAPGAIKTSEGYTHVGTSFAAPVVSAAIAVIREAWPYLNAAQITDILFTTATDIGDPGVDEVYGHGMLDLENATRPVGELSIVVADNNVRPLQNAGISGQLAHNIKSANPTIASFDKYGRAYETRVSDNVSVRNRGLGFERLRGNDNRAKIEMGGIEFGFYRSDMLNGTGFLQTDGETTTSYIATNNSFSFGGLELFTRSQFGTAHPIASSESMISDFSNVYTASASIGVRGDAWSLSVGVPETIVRGTMNLHTAFGRLANGAITYQDYKIDMAGAPSIEYTANYHFLTAGFVDNPYGKDEFYIFAKTKLSF